MGSFLRFQEKTFAGKRENGVQQLLLGVRRYERVSFNYPVEASCAKQAVIL
jgi:hypothetical protein